MFISELISTYIHWQLNNPKGATSAEDPSSYAAQYLDTTTTNEKKETKVPWLPWQSCLLNRQRIIPLNLPVAHMCQPHSWALCEFGTQSSCNLSRCVIFQAWLVERLACLVPIKDEAKFTITHPERARTHTHTHTHADSARVLSAFCASSLIVAEVLFFAAL